MGCLVRSNDLLSMIDLIALTPLGIEEIDSAVE